MPQDLVMDLIKPIHLLFYFFAYTLAATPTSYLVARFIHQTRIKTRAAHSFTASYAWRELAKTSGFLIFVLDLLKGLIPCAIAQSLDVPVEAISLTALCAVLGHCFSPWLAFLGGHGGATLAGAMMIIFWPAAIGILATNLVVIVLGFSVGHASIIAALVGTMLLFWGLMNKVVWLIVTVIAIIIITRHQKDMVKN
jgi:acyl phosphate:glycerol-3-phosphate acyltransferase